MLTSSVNVQGFPRIKICDLLHLEQHLHSIHSNGKLELSGTWTVACLFIYHTISIQDCAQYTQQKLTFMVADTCLRYSCGLKQNTAWYMTGKDFSVILKLHRYFCLQKSCWKI